MSTRQPMKGVTKIFVNSASWRWFQKIVLLIIFSVVLNHLATKDSFPGNDSYRFPIEGFLSTIVLSTLIGIIAHFNFEFYKKKYFSKKVETSTIIRFMVSTHIYITLMYIPLNFLINIIAGGQEMVLYYLIVGLLITLLICFVFIGLWYAQDIYDLYKRSIKDAEITIESGAKVTKLTYEHIMCFYIENKIVYTVKKDGSIIHTDFTLNELEEKINDQLFFRANRKIIVHKDAIGQVEKIENGKLRVRLKNTIDYDQITEINISRYKRKEFMDWFQ